MNFQDELNRKTKEAEAILERYLPLEEGFPRTLAGAMRYSLTAGGKRLRMLLLGESYHAAGGSEKVAEPFMAGMEMIHTHSLIHDDLPALDYDDYRRGRLTTHKVYGEALGILAGSTRRKWVDHIFVILDQVLMAIPPFFFGIISCFLFGIVLKWFMPGNFISLKESPARCIAYLILPAVCLALPRIAMTVRMLRSSVQEELAQNYVLTARSRGLSRGGIIQRHVLKNAMIPVVTFLAVSAAEIMTGTIIIEQVFTIPGTGRLLVSSIGNRDFPVVQAIIVILAAWIVIVNFAADMLNRWMDPRMRVE